MGNKQGFFVASYYVFKLIHLFTDSPFIFFHDHSRRASRAEATARRAARHACALAQQVALAWRVNP
jgi:hypothetical protein